MEEQLWQLRAGDRFTFGNLTEVYVVETPRLIDYYGESILLYRDTASALHGHLVDHTEVFVVL